MVLIDTNNRPIGKTVNDPPSVDSVDREVLRVIRVIEQSKRIGLPDLCAQLEEANKAGWRIMIDDGVPENNAQVTMLRHTRRSVDNKLQHKGERGWVSLGVGYADALQMVVEERARAVDGDKVN